MDAIVTGTEVEKKILHRLNFEPSLGCTFGHLMTACGFSDGGLVDGKTHDRILDCALQRLRKRGVIWFSKLTREWVLR